MDFRALALKSSWLIMFPNLFVLCFSYLQDGVIVLLPSVKRIKISYT